MVSAHLRNLRGMGVESAQRERLKEEGAEHVPFKRTQLGEEKESFFGKIGKFVEKVKESRPVQKVKEIREANIERRERISRVKRAAKEKETGMSKKELDAEAVSVSKELGVSYEDAFEYVKSERKSAARKKTLQKVAGTLSDVGAKAREQTKRTMHTTTVGRREAFRPRSPFESSFSKPRVAPTVKPQNPFELHVGSQFKPRETSKYKKKHKEVTPTVKPRNPFRSSFGTMKTPKQANPFKPHMDLYRKRH